MKVQLVDPAAYTPAYDHALASALAASGAQVELATAPFPYGAVPTPAGYERVERFYEGLSGAAGSRGLRARRALHHIPDMLNWRRSATGFDVAHAQWFAVQALDGWLLPSGVPLVMTAHDVLPREPRRGQRAAQARLWDRADALVVHSQHGRDRLVAEAGINPEKISVIPHGPLTFLGDLPGRLDLPAELVGPGSRGEVPVALSFGLIRPYKGIEVLLEAWTGIGDAELWIVGRPRMDITELKRRAPANVKWVDRYVDDREIAPVFEAADMCVLPYLEIDQSGVLATALAFRKPLLLSDVGGFPEVAGHGAAATVPAGDVAALRAELTALMFDSGRRSALATAGERLARDIWSWDTIAGLHLDLYARLGAGS